MDKENPKSCGKSRILGKHPGPGRTRLKTGCRTCKIRRVKCDEGRPACRRCVSTGRVCDGYGIWGGGGNAYGSKERRQTPAKAQKTPMDHLQQCLLWRRAPAAITGMGPQEQVALDYFRTRTVHKLAGVFISNFWESTVFQVSFAEPAVLHAVISLGAVHRNESGIAANAESGRSTQSNESLGLQHYNKAIRYLVQHGKSHDKQSLRSVLIACVVFICLELLRCRFRTARAHLQSGLKLLSEMQSHPRRTGRVERKPTDGEDSSAVPTQHASVDDQLRVSEVLTRLNIHSTLFGQGVGYLQDTVFGYTFSAAIDDMPQFFQTADDARQHLDRLIDGVSCLSAQIKSSRAVTRESIPADFVQQKERLQTSLSRWLRTYTASLSSLTPTVANLKTSISLLLLRLYHIMASIMASTCLRGADEG